MYAVDQLLPELEIEASKNLSELTDGRFGRIRLETYEEGRGHGIRILVQGVDGEWHDVAEFSGGEKTQINAALRFAIARELASMPQIGRTFGRMKTLFIDEGDLGSLDTEISRELFVQKLLRMCEARRGPARAPTADLFIDAIPVSFGQPSQHGFRGAKHSPRTLP